MTTDRSAYAALGLEPGAGADAVEEAYRRLIRRHHPDRPDGDGPRAAEITWAYRHLRDKLRREHLPCPVPQRREPPAQSRRLASRRRRWLRVLLVSVLALAVLQWPAIERRFDGSPTDRFDGGFDYQPLAARAGPLDLGAEPLDTDGIDRSALSAARLLREADSERLLGQSRRCYAELRRTPELARLDRCVAFDEAALLLLQRSGGDESGAFSAASILGRHVSAARLWTDDYFAIEQRLRRIRSRVEFSLAPADAP